MPRSGWSGRFYPAALTATADADDLRAIASIAAKEVNYCLSWLAVEAPSLCDLDAVGAGLRRFDI